MTPQEIASLCEEKQNQLLPTYFGNIMEDGIVTEEEVKAQSDKVIAMLHVMEAKYSQEQLAEIKSLLAETSVLYAVYNFHSIQNIDK